MIIGKCKDCRYWKASAKYSSERYPKTVFCIYRKIVVGRLDTCSDWNSTSIEPTCYNCIHLNRDEGRAYLYGYGFCIRNPEKTWVNVETNRATCRYHVFRRNNDNQ